MKTPKEVQDAKGRMITQGKMMSELKGNQAFILVMEHLQVKTDEARENILNAQTWEDFVEKKAYYDGLLSLAREVDTILTRGKSQEKLLKK